MKGSFKKRWLLFAIFFAGVSQIFAEDSGGLKPEEIIDEENATKPEELKTVNQRNIESNSGNKNSTALETISVESNLTDNETGICLETTASPSVENNSSSSNDNATVNETDKNSAPPAQPSLASSTRIESDGDDDVAKASHKEIGEDEGFAPKHVNVMARGKAFADDAASLTDKRKEMAESPVQSGEDKNTSHTAVPVVASGSAAGGKHGVLYVKTETRVDKTGINLSCTEKRTPLIPIFFNSKFFGDWINKYNYTEARAVCEENYMVIADLESIVDHHSIEIYFNHNINPSFVPETDRFYIGMNDLEVEGVYKRGNGKKLLFQNYQTSQPDDKDMQEDCTVLGKEYTDGPVGALDEACSKKFHVICQHPPDTDCYKESVETGKNKLLEKKLMKIAEVGSKAYHVSTFQDTWEHALLYCRNHSMTLFDMDSIVDFMYFWGLIKWENTYLNASDLPPPQYWTAGKFRETHMNAPVFWHSKDEHSYKAGPQRFSFSGIFRWSTRKAKDPGGPYNARRDLCMSYAFEMRQGPIPYVRNTNCELPAYFVCRQEVTDSELGTLFGDKKKNETDGDYIDMFDGHRDRRDGAVVVDGDYEAPLPQDERGVFHQSFKYYFKYKAKPIPAPT